MTNQFSSMISLTKYCVNIRKKTLDLYMMIDANAAITLMAKRPEKTFRL